jgi:hypothetical protein
MHAIVCITAYRPEPELSVGADRPVSPGELDMEERGMRSRLWLVLVGVATLMVAACSQEGETPSTAAQVPAATTSCASTGAALSLILALTILAFTVVQLLLTRRSHA